MRRCFSHRRAQRHSLVQHILNPQVFHRRLNAGLVDDTVSLRCIRVPGPHFCAGHLHRHKQRRTLDQSRKRNAAPICPEQQRARRLVACRLSRDRALSRRQRYAYAGREFSKSPLSVEAEIVQIPLLEISGQRAHALDSRVPAPVDRTQTDHPALDHVARHSTFDTHWPDHRLGAQRIALANRIALGQGHAEFGFVAPMRPRVWVMNHVARFDLEHRWRRRIHLAKAHRLRRRGQRVNLAMPVRVKNARPVAPPFAGRSRMSRGAQDHRGPTDTSQLQQATPAAISSAIACEPAMFIVSQANGVIEIIRLAGDALPCSHLPTPSSGFPNPADVGGR
ncbi:hypothetical protein CNECB9_3590007 [Cupriavidus necator]|uniref:Uncharacterized protein n=1 Tax=Cupriavidus necator TaxID=106590 RepID=A0A1K0JD42_CUPNE|nr:hypothetical protein CNECB9_3590007 [Cupriavidus necator]